MSLIVGHTVGKKVKSAGTRGKKPLLQRFFLFVGNFALKEL
jgi:hypothetical protein